MPLSKQETLELHQRNGLLLQAVHIRLYDRFCRGGGVRWCIKPFTDRMDLFCMSCINKSLDIFAFRTSIN